MKRNLSIKVSLKTCIADFELIYTVYICICSEKQAQHYLQQMYNEVMQVEEEKKEEEFPLGGSKLKMCIHVFRMQGVL